MVIKGIVKTTLLDYPGKLAATVFTEKCNFRCPFCHNSDLVLRSDKLIAIPEEEVFSFLKRRKKILEGICITGGEPTLHSDLGKFCKKCKKLGYLVKVDTNGSSPKLIEELIKKKRVDYVAVDYKGPFDKYDEYIFLRKGKKRKSKSKVEEKVLKTIEVLLKNKVDFELRTTVVPGLHSGKDLLKMAKDLKKLKSGSDFKIKWFWQNFRPLNCLDKEFNKVKPYKKEWFEKVLGKIKGKKVVVEYRGEE